MTDELLSVESSGLVAIANAIRTKGNTNAPLTFPAGFVSALQAITTEATVTPKITPQQKVLTPSDTSFSIDAGFHDGTGTVSIQTETGSANPTSTQQTYYPSAGKFFSSFAVGGIGSGVQAVTGTKTFASASDNFVVSGLGFTPQGILLFSVPDPTLKEYVNQYTSAISVPNLTPSYAATAIDNISGSSYGLASIGLFSYSSSNGGTVTIEHAGYNRFLHTYFYIVFG